MLLPKRLMACPMLLALLLVVPGCAKQVAIQPAFPPAADLQVEPKPIPGENIVTSGAAAAEYDIAIESWGARGWNAVGRICRWAKGQGAPVSCPE